MSRLLCLTELLRRRTTNPNLFWRSFSPQGQAFFATASSAGRRDGDVPDDVDVGGRAGPRRECEPDGPGQAGLSALQYLDAVEVNGDDRAQRAALGHVDGDGVRSGCQHLDALGLAL